MKSGTVIAIVLVVVIVLGGAYFLFGQNSYKSPSTPSDNMNTPTPSTSTSPTPTPSTTPSGSGAMKSVSIAGFAFNPSDLVIGVGDTVVWTNGDSAHHIIVSDSGSEISSENLAQGQMYSHTFTKAGTYEYHCSIHPSMKGKVVVQ